MTSLKNLLLTGIGVASLALTGSLNANAQLSLDPEKYAKISKKLDSLQILGINYFNKSDTNLTKCFKEEENRFLCFDQYLKDISLSKKYFEEYVSIFEKNKKVENLPYVATLNRDLGLLEAKELIKNENLIIEYANDLLNKPSLESNEKWVNQIDKTVERTNTYFAPEGIRDFRDLNETQK